MMMHESKAPTKYRQTLRGKILDTAMQAFARYGVKAVKMDDIAQRLGISKRTLYEIYENKEVLLFEGVKYFKTERESQLEQLLKDSDNVMTGILAIYKRHVEDFRKVNPQFYADLAMYPQVKRFLEKDKKQGHDRFMKFMNRGVAEGYFREDVDYHFVTMMFNALGEYISNHELYRQFTIEQLFRNIIFVSLRGFCTPKGVALLDSFLAE